MSTHEFICICFVLLCLVLLLEDSNSIACSVGNVLRVGPDVGFEVIENTLLRQCFPYSFVCVYEQVVPMSAHSAVFMCAGDVGVGL